jgi:hypothetical protein
MLKVWVLSGMKRVLRQQSMAGQIFCKDHNACATFVAVRFLKQKILVGISIFAFSASALADGFTANLGLGYSPTFGSAFTSELGLKYDLDLTENISLASGFTFNDYKLNLFVTPEFSSSIFKDGASDLKAYAGLETTLGVLPVPVNLTIKPYAGLSLKYLVSDAFTTQGKLEAGLGFFIDGKPLAYRPYLKLSGEGTYVLVSQASLGFGAKLALYSGSLGYNPYLNTTYTLNPNIAFLGELGYTGGIGWSSSNSATASFGSFYLVLRTQFKF